MYTVIYHRSYNENDNSLKIPVSSVALSLKLLKWFQQKSNFFFVVLSICDRIELNVFYGPSEPGREADISVIMHNLYT